MPHCENCGAYVTAEFERVFGNNNDEVYGCLDCEGGTAVKNGAAIEGGDSRTHLGPGHTPRGR